MRHAFLTAILVTLVSIPGSAAPATAPAADNVRRDDRARKQLEQYEDEHSRTLQQLSQIRHDIRKQTGLVEVSSEVIRQLIVKLQEQREQLELDLVGGEVRQTAMEEAVAKMTKQLRERAESDGYLQQLATVVELREKQVQRTEQLIKTGNAPLEEVEKAQASLATARAEFLAARQKASAGGSVDAVDGWNRQLLELSITHAERKAKLRFITQRLEVFSGVLPAIDESEKLQVKAEQLQHMASKLSEDLAAMRRAE